MPTKSSVMLEESNDEDRSNVPGRALGRLYADNADWVTVGGERHKGRVAIEGVLAKEHASWARTTILRATDVAVRAINSENAIVMFKWEITRAKESRLTPLRQHTVRGRKA